MARKPSRSPRARESASGGNNSLDAIVAVFFKLLAEKPIESISLAEIAREAAVSLADLRSTYDSKLAMVAAHMKAIDRAVLAGGDADMAEEPPRERLFDVLMRRFEAMAADKAAIVSLLRSSRRNPPLALCLNRLAVQSQQWMLAAADIGANGPRGMIRAQGLALIFVRVMDTWARDDDPGLARTMSALDRGLARGQRWSGWLDDLEGLALCACRVRRRRRRDDADESVAAA
ncbi:MAG: TetR/AcrR family transcriptional regulator [Proteobacteria bacterium]|nr:TetR/AcrR family transcriptional regulator [Pseudomonadota bacterium]